MKLIKHFDAFLKNKVNLNESRIATLDSRVEAVTNFLSSGDDAIATNFVELIPQGSYAHRTIIKPVGANDEFDADVLLELTEVSGWEAKDYVQELYTVFRSGSTYRNMVNRRSRCVTVDYASDFHIDVVPYLERHDERYITNRSDNVFELTHPEGFNAWLDEQNRLTSGRLVKVLRLMKYIRDYKNTFTVKSVILTILVGGRVSGAALLANPNRYQDLPTAFVTLLEDLNAYLQANPTVPIIADPSCPSENFNHRINQDQYTNLRKWIKTYAEWARDAYDEPDLAESYTKWRKLLGEKFGTFATVALKESAAHLSVPGVTDTEEHIEDKFQVALNPAYRIKIQARTARRDGFRTYTLSAWGNKVAKTRKLHFSIQFSNVPEPYELWWKVRNTGQDAITRNMIRGQIVKDAGSRTRSEPATFRGNHYVEVYAVKNGVVVAKDHHPVIIT